jgi:phosphoribosylformimino-5-aminoimidazole carboxamide ribotide isomerase
VVVGSLSVTRPERVADWLGEFGADRLVAALDVQIDEQGTPWPRTHGWTRGSGQTLWALLDFHADRGLKHVLCTDIGRDGAMTGPNLALYREITRRYPDLLVQASGGVSGLVDLKNLSGTGVHSAITGKALLEGCFTVAEAMDVLL